MRRTPRSLRYLGLLLAFIVPVAGACSDEDDPIETTDTTESTDDTTESTEVTEDTTDTTDEESDAEVPEGFAEVQGEGVHLAAPEDWQAVDLSEEDFEQVFEDAAEANPELAEALEGQAAQLAAEGAVLFAINPTMASFADNVNVVEVPGAVPSVSELEGQADTIVESFGGDLVGSEMVELPAGEALRVEYTLDLNAADGTPVTAQGFQYYVLGDDNAYVVTVTLAEDSDPSIADDIAETFVIE
jgi:hypothetical protein